MSSVYKVLSQFQLQSGFVTHPASMFRIIIGSFLLLALIASSLARPEEDWISVEDWSESSDSFDDEIPMIEEPEDPTRLPEVVYDIFGDEVDMSRVGETLKVYNGGRWGSWGEAAFCPDGSYAAGYNMKIQPKQGSGDDTSLNAIMIECKDKEDHTIGEHSSAVGDKGNWVGWTFCHQHGDHSDFMTSFALQVEKKQGLLKDDTAANYVKFNCRCLNVSNSHEYTIVKPPGHGFWGDWGGWSQSCPPGQAICGMRTKVEKSHWYKETTGLNDAIFYCCK